MYMSVCLCKDAVLSTVNESDLYSNPLPKLALLNVFHISFF